MILTVITCDRCNPSHTTDAVATRGRGIVVCDFEHAKEFGWEKINNQHICETCLEEIKNIQ